MYLSYLSYPPDGEDDDFAFPGMEKRYAYEKEEKSHATDTPSNMIESMFDVAMQKFEIDEMDDPEEAVVMKGAVPASAFNHIFDEFLKGTRHFKSQLLAPPQVLRTW